jgi:hypothetical protein
VTDDQFRAAYRRREWPFGHGGCLAVVTQARHRVFDAIAVLGFSAVAGAVPTRGQDEDFVNALRWAFHSDDADPALVDADLGSGYPDRRRLPPWGSSSMPSDFVRTRELLWSRLHGWAEGLGSSPPPG